MKALKVVIPAQAGIQTIRNPLRTLVFRFHPLGSLPASRASSPEGRPLGAGGRNNKNGLWAAFLGI